jgi:TRAP-type C4-dicarboxylate transport system substrate-binding protein
MTRRPAVWALLLLLLWAGVAQAQVVRWTMANEYPATSIQGEADARFAKEVSERSGTRIQITNQYDAASGFKSKDMVDAVAKGSVPLANAYMGALGAVDPVFLLPSLPYLATTPEQAQALAQIARPALEQALEKHDQKLLFLSPWPAAGLWANKPVDSVQALRGLRVRTADANGVAAFKAAGATPVQVSFADAIPQLKSGQLDAVLSSGDGGAGKLLMETLKHFTQIDYAITMSVVTLNLKEWNALDEDLQAAVFAAATITEARQWDVLKTRVADNYKAMKDAGVTITTELTPEYREALSRAGQGVVAEWARVMGPAGADILTAYRSRTGSAR